MFLWVFFVWFNNFGRLKKSSQYLNVFFLPLRVSSPGRPSYTLFLMASVLIVPGDTRARFLSFFYNQIENHPLFNFILVNMQPWFGFATFTVLILCHTLGSWIVFTYLCVHYVMLCLLTLTDGNIFVCSSLFQAKLNYSTYIYIFYHRKVLLNLLWSYTASSIQMFKLDVNNNKGRI